MESTESKNFNQRHFQMMAEEIDGFRHQKISLGYFVKRLKELNSVLMSPSKDWAENFLSEWGALETVNALHLDRRERGLIPNQDDETDILRSPFVNDAVEHIDRLVQAELHK